MIEIICFIEKGIKMSENGNKKKSTTIDRLLEGLLLVLVALFLIGIIFFFSEQSGGQSHSMSRTIASYIARDWNNLFKLNLDEDSLAFVTKILDYPIRKLAHVVEYLLLGFGVYGSINLMNRNKNKLLYLLLTLLLVMSVACFDELNQFFSGGRGSSIRDVLLDTIGGAIGIYLVILIKDFIRHIRNLFSRSKS